MTKTETSTLRASRAQFVPYFLALLGVAAGLGAHIAFARHYEPYRITVLGLLWTALPFIVCAVTAYAVRRSWRAEVAIGLATVLLLVSCLRYRGVTDDDDQPFFIFGFMPAFQLFALIALLPALTGVALFIHKHHIKPASRRNS